MGPSVWEGGVFLESQTRPPGRAFRWVGRLEKRQEVVYGPWVGTRTNAPYVIQRKNVFIESDEVNLKS